jgi:hypothetical protein
MDPLWTLYGHVSQQTPAIAFLQFTADSENLVMRQFEKKNWGGRTAAAVVYRQ